MSHHNSFGGIQSRREFLRRGALLAGVGFATPWALDLSSLASASGPSGADDDDGSYRALVCLFMYGGNDAYDTFIPNDPASYATYAAARDGIARPFDSIVGIDPIGGFEGAGTFGFAPELSGLKALFDAGDAAVVSNVGTLVRPLDKTSWQVESNRPPQLFSHNDQQSFWQASSPEGATTGWAGRIGDLVLDDNGAHSTFTSISVSGNAVLMNGRDAFQHQVSPSGVTKLNHERYRYDAVGAGIREVMELQSPGPFDSSYANLSRRALTAADDLSEAIDAASAQHNFAQHFDLASENPAVSRTSAQLHMVAQLIAAGRETLGIKRQVFFVGMGGFDNHSGLVSKHRPLLTGLDSSLTSFHTAMQAMGAGDDVTTFTASDFGRTLTGNGDGSDHGWGGHHMVVGGSVAGNRVYGKVPEIADDGPDDVGRGRLLPSTSVDEYASTMARWMGATTSELPEILPNLANHDSDDLGFMTRIPVPETPATPTTTTTTTTVPTSTKQPTSPPENPGGGQPEVSSGVLEVANALRSARRVSQN